MTLAAESIVVLRPGDRRVLDHVSCRIEPGRLTGIVGPNGAGKSTLLRALAGIHVPADGRVTLDGADLSGIDRHVLARAVAYLPQERAVSWPLPIERVVALGRLPYRAGPTALATDLDRDAVAAAIRTMDLEPLADRPADQISGGELARVLIARALAQQSRVILADEPTAGLDPSHALALFEVLARLTGDGKGIAVALHDLSLAARFCHDVVVLAEGRVVATGPAREVLTPERLEPVFGVRFACREVEGVPVVIPVSPLRPGPA